MRTFHLLLYLLLSKFSFSQDVKSRLDKAINLLMQDSQFKHSTVGLYVVDTKTGKPVFDINSEVGLAPASCQKIVTSASAFELLGSSYKYKTTLGYWGSINGNILDGNLFIKGNGDPTLGSRRYADASAANMMNRWMHALNQKGIKHIQYVRVRNTGFSAQFIPGGWVWEDVGNYYGAGAAAVNWRENQFDIILRSGNAAGDKVDIIGKNPENYGGPFINELVTAAKGSGDNAYVYLPTTKDHWLLKGTIPAGEKKFTISAAMKDPATCLEDEFLKRLDSDHVSYNRNDTFLLLAKNSIESIPGEVNPLISFNTQPLDEYFSPPLDSINYWFLKKSINLYGEAFVKSIGLEKKGVGSTDSGISIIKDFWSKKGIESSALNIIDGSGLSPANRITTNALVQVLQYSKKQSWFTAFYNALPEMNGIKMKDGYIGGVRSYTGYVRSASGAEYSFAFIVNNFTGNPGTVREKMWMVLNILK